MKKLLAGLGLLLFAASASIAQDRHPNHGDPGGSQFGQQQGGDGNGGDSDGSHSKHDRNTPTIYSLSGFGMPLQGTGNDDGGSIDLQIFATGQNSFKEVEGIPALGPIFNSRACGACHFQPALGGSGGFIQEVRVRNNTAGGPLHIFATDNLLRLGPQSQGGLAIFPQGVESTPLGCQITSPNCTQSACQKEEAKRTTFATGLQICDPKSASFTGGDNCTAERQSTPLFGLGLVEAVADQTLIDLAASEPAAVQGTVKQISELGATRVARFGWKDDHATLRAFSGDAYLNEIGFTNPDNPVERTKCALNVVQFGVTLDADDEPEDATDSGGRADTDRFTDFMRALAPPPTVPLNGSASAGQQLFSQIGCAGCHMPSLTTDSNPASFIPPTTGGVAITSSLNASLANQTIQPYSDFLLHDMGSLGDGITSGAAGATMMRTAPLWGVRGKSKLLHDGRADDIASAISRHDGQGKAAAQSFANLTAAQQQNVLDFLDSI